METTTKYFYMRDPKNYNRVITVARHLDGKEGLIYFGIAICQPECPAEQRKGDRFVKSLGRTISEGRMHLAMSNATTTTGNGIVSVLEDKPIRAILKDLCYDHRLVVSRTAKYYLNLDDQTH